MDDGYSAAKGLFESRHIWFLQSGGRIEEARALAQERRLFVDSTRQGHTGPPRVQGRDGQEHLLDKKIEREPVRHHIQGTEAGGNSELDYVLKNPEQVFKCVVFIETMRHGRSYRRCLTKMLEDDLRAVGMRVAEFAMEGDEELFGLASGTLLDFLY